MNELKEGFSQELEILSDFFRNERGKTGELVDGPFATIVGFSKMSPESALDRKNSSVGRYCPPNAEWHEFYCEDFIGDSDSNQHRVEIQHPHGKEGRTRDLAKNTRRGSRITNIMIPYSTNKASELKVVEDHLRYSTFHNCSHPILDSQVDAQNLTAGFTISRG